MFKLCLHEFGTQAGVEGGERGGARLLRDLIMFCLYLGVRLSVDFSVSVGMCVYASMPLCERRSYCKT